MNHKKIIHLALTLLVGLMFTSNVDAASRKRKEPPPSADAGAQAPNAKAARTDADIPASATPIAAGTTATTTTVTAPEATNSFLTRVLGYVGSWFATAPAAGSASAPIDLVEAEPTAEERAIATEFNWVTEVTAGTRNGFALDQVPEHLRPELEINHAPEPAEPYQVVFGLENSTATHCFINCVLQLLTHNAPFMNTLEPLIGGAAPQLPAQPHAVIAGWYWYLHELKTNIYFDNPLHSIFSPVLLVQAILKSYFDGEEHRQHDAGEALGRILDTLSEAYPAAINPCVGCTYHELKRCSAGHQFPKDRECQLFCVNNF